MREALLGRLLAQVAGPDLLLEGVGEERLRARPEPAVWSAHENLAHLGRHHEVFLARVDRILAEDVPALPRYQAEEDPEWPAWAARSTPDVLDRLHRLRADLIARLGALSARQWEREGRHGRFGTMSLALWVEFFLDHEGHHLYVVLERSRGNG